MKTRKQMTVQERVLARNYGKVINTYCSYIQDNDWKWDENANQLYEEFYRLHKLYVAAGLEFPKRNAETAKMIELYKSNCE